MKIETGLATPEISTGASPDDHLVAIWLHGRSVHTQRGYAGDIARFRPRAGKPLHSVTLADLQLFADSLRDLAPATRHRMLSAVKSLLAFGHRIGYVAFDVGGRSACRECATVCRNASSRKPTSTACSAGSSCRWASSGRTSTWPTSTCS